MKNSNTYVWVNVGNKPTYGNFEGAWAEIPVEGLKNSLV